MVAFSKLEFTLNISNYRGKIVKMMKHYNANDRNFHYDCPVISISSSESPFMSSISINCIHLFWK